MPNLTPNSLGGTAGNLGLKFMFTPVTATYTVPFGMYFLFLTGRIVKQRISTYTLFGDHHKQPPKGKTTGTTTAPDSPDQDSLYLAVRSQANFLEYVPMGLFFAALAELNGGSRSVINYALGTLFALRVAHVEFGLLIQNSMGWGRVAGFYGTAAWLAGMAGYAGWGVKEYWGF